MLQPQDRDQAAHSIINIETVSGLNYQSQDFSLAVNEENGEIQYTYGNGRFMNFGFYTSENKGGSRFTKSWDKYGRKQDKTEHITPGMYIMFNTGNLTRLSHKYESIRVGLGENYRKIYLKSNVISLELTIKVNEPYVVDTVFTFSPPTNAVVDYFLKVSSEVSSSTLYHDSNGYLVSRRPLNWRPDYNYEIKPEDAINGNNYPATVFAYLLDSDKKFVFFSDRAQGVCAYNSSLLINFDRLAYDDGKGVGEVYMKRK